MLSLPGRDAADDADSHVAQVARRTYRCRLDGIGDGRPDDLAAAEPRERLERRLRVCDHGARQDPRRHADESHRGAGQVVRRNAVADVPHHRHAREASGEAAVERGLERVRVDQVGAEIAQPPAEAKDVRRELRDGADVYAAGTDALLAEVAHVGRERQDLGRDPGFAEPGHERPVFT